MTHHHRHQHHDNNSTRSKTNKLQRALRYALFSRLSYYDYDITDEELSVIDTDVNKVAFIDRKSQVWVFRADQGRELVVTFRGSDSLGDLLDNLCIRPARFKDIPLALSALEYKDMWVHSGYLSSYKAVRSSVMLRAADHVLARISKVGSEKVTPVITVCGHSLGGALASMCAMDMCGFFGPGVHINCFTYGSPPCAEGAFYKVASQRTNEFRRIVHRHDFAPKMPMVFFGHPNDGLMRLTHVSRQAHSHTSIKDHVVNRIRHHSIESYIGAIRRQLVRLAPI